MPALARHGQSVFSSAPAPARHGQSVSTTAPCRVADCRPRSTAALVQSPARSVQRAPDRWASPGCAQAAPAVPATVPAVSTNTDTAGMKREESCAMGFIADSLG